MTTPHKHAAAIKAWADGAIIQYRANALDPWRDCGNVTPGWSEYAQYRVKPVNIVRYHALVVAPPSGVYLTHGTIKRDVAASHAGYGKILKGILRVEIDPVTFELVSAAVEKP